jgi:hypothetical protein
MQIPVAVLLRFKFSNDQPMHFFKTMKLSVIDGLVQGLLTAGQARQTLAEYLRSRPKIGQLAVELALLKPEQVVEVLARHAISQKRFGETAIELGYLTTADVDRLLTIQHERARPIADILASLGVSVDASLGIEWTPGPTDDPHLQL